jgi:N-methylhydantoinase B
MGQERLGELVAARGLDQVQAYAGYLQDYSERLMRAAVVDIPDGEYRFEDFLDGDGFGREEVRIAVAVRVRGDSAEVDFTGTDPQVEGPMNANFAVTLSAVAYAFRCLGPEALPFNGGCFAPLRVKAPEGTVVNARAPAAVCGGNVETSQRIVDTVLGALSRAVGDRIPAAGQGTMNNVAVGGLVPETGEPFTYYETLAGGAGAGPSGPGASAVHTQMTNTRNTPVEALEHAYPLVVLRYAVRRGSGGRGRHRGGDGLVRAFRVDTEASLTLLTERRSRGPWGRKGGAPGTPGRNLLVRSGREEVLPAKTQIRLQAGDVVRIETPGGGAYGEEEAGPGDRNQREEA